MSLSRLKRQFSSSSKLSQDGVWITIDIGDGDRPFEFLIARMGRGNRKWTSQASRFFRYHKRKIDAGLFNDQDALEKSIRLFCNTVLLDWKHVEDENGQPIQYTPEVGVKVLVDCPELYDYLSDEAQEVQNFQEEEVKSTVGNSRSASTGI